VAPMTRSVSALWVEELMLNTIAQRDDNRCLMVNEPRLSAEHQLSDSCPAAIQLPRNFFRSFADRNDQKAASRRAAHKLLLIEASSARRRRTIASRLDGRTSETVREFVVACQAFSLHRLPDRQF
jgi:hypothetical protein